MGRGDCTLHGPPGARGIRGPAGHLTAYREPAFFTIVNYEQVLGDAPNINEILHPDMVVLDEAQRIKNWQIKTARQVKSLRSPYAVRSLAACKRPNFGSLVNREVMHDLGAPASEIPPGDSPQRRNCILTQSLSGTNRKYSDTPLRQIATRLAQSDNWRRDFGATQHVRRAASVRVLNHHTIRCEFCDLVAKRYCREGIVTA
jgi:hypothetical protein